MFFFLLLAFIEEIEENYMRAKRLVRCNNPIHIIIDIAEIKIYYVVVSFDVIGIMRILYSEKHKIYMIDCKCCNRVSKYIENL